MNRRRLAVYLLMAGSILHHLLSNEYSAFDRFVELGVFLLILIEGIISLRNYWSKKRRVKMLESMIGTGQEIQRSVPEPDHNGNYKDYEPVRDWTARAEGWIKETRASLEKTSSRAAASFVLIIDPTDVSSMVQVEGKAFPIYGHPREVYQRLVSHLINLKNMMENPDAYF
jgi:hypothetical protein